MYVSLRALRGDDPIERGKRPRLQFGRKQSLRIDGPRERDLSRRHGAKAEAPVVGHIADEDAELHAIRLGRLQRLADQPLAEALAGQVGIDGERAEQQRAAQPADAYWR